MTQYFPPPDDHQFSALERAQTQNGALIRELAQRRTSHLALAEELEACRVTCARLRTRVTALEAGATLDSKIVRAIEAVMPTAIAMCRAEIEQSPNLITFGPRP